MSGGDGAVRFGLRAFRRHAPPFDFMPPRLSFAFPPGLRTNP
ncbi:transcriptional regulator [Burkholderia thailandensis]|nr:transcriptional regulator [Burkholderia thailandensis]